MSNHARNRRHGPGWLDRGVKLQGRKVRTKAKGERTRKESARRTERLIGGRNRQHARRRV